MKKSLTKNLEWSVLICTVLLTVIGLFAIYSATLSAELEEFKKQLMWIAISIPVMIVVVLVDYDILAKVSPVLYGVIVIALIGVLFTAPIYGATSWFTIGSVSIQPSEFAKIFVILFLALVMSRMKKKGEKEISRPTRLILLILIMAVPIALIVKQPDYGTATAFAFAFIAMLFMGGLFVWSL